MDENNRTDKQLLTKGLKQMAICLVLMFFGPYLLNVSLYNDKKDFYIPLLILSILLCVAAIAMLFIGLNTIANSMFKKKK